MRKRLIIGLFACLLRPSLAISEPAPDAAIQALVVKLKDHAGAVSLLEGYRVSLLLPLPESTFVAGDDMQVKFQVTGKDPIKSVTVVTEFETLDLGPDINEVTLKIPSHFNGTFTLLLYAMNQQEIVGLASSGRLHVRPSA